MLKGVQENSDPSKDNMAFWDELCGTARAKSLGLVDSSPESLARFDRWFFNSYPYLTDHIKFESLENKQVLEVGLGYGSVAQKLAASGASYIGLDIAHGPVDMANYRMRQQDLPGLAMRGSILEPRFDAGSFDSIVAIGSLHHTGNLALALENCWKLLRPGGQLTLMVYYAYSYRRILMHPRVTARYWRSEIRGYRGVVQEVDLVQRAGRDVNTAGQAAPHTDWISKRSLQALGRKFSSVQCRLENAYREGPFIFLPRAVLLRSPLPQVMGVDLYATLTK